MSGPAPAPLVNLTVGLRRLKLAAMVELAPKMLFAAKTPRWTPEEILRTLIDVEITSRDASKHRARLKAPRSRS